MIFIRSLPYPPLLVSSPPLKVGESPLGHGALSPASPLWNILTIVTVTFFILSFLLGGHPLHVKSKSHFLAVLGGTSILPIWGIACGPSVSFVGRRLVVFGMGSAFVCILYRRSIGNACWCGDDWSGRSVLEESFHRTL